MHPALGTRTPGPPARPHHSLTGRCRPPPRPGARSVSRDRVDGAARCGLGHPRQAEPTHYVRGPLRSQNDPSGAPSKLRSNMPGEYLTADQVRPRTRPQLRSVGGAAANMLLTAQIQASARVAANDRNAHRALPIRGHGALPQDRQVARSVTTAPEPEQRRAQASQRRACGQPVPLENRIRLETCGSSGVRRRACIR